MIEHGMYIIKHSYFDMVRSLGITYADEQAASRPVYCCIKDSKIDGLYWAIPTSDWSHRTPEQQAHYIEWMGLPSRDMRSNYYHKARTSKEALFKISSCFPITEDFIDHEFMSYGEHVIMRRSSDIEEILRKLKRILALESSNKNYFPQQITTLKNHLIEELNNQ